MKEVLRLLEGNAEWQKGKLAADPQFFARLEGQQSPDFLWIGCSDSRVPANEITNTDPGEIFVHRNIANQVYPHDLNLLAVLDFAINQLQVKHIIVCGHYGCGGVAAAASGKDFKPILNNWLEGMVELHRTHQDELTALATEEERLDRLTELNVIAQVQNLSNSSLIRAAWQSGAGPDLHGWVYRLKDGIIKPLLEMKAGHPLTLITTG